MFEWICVREWYTLVDGFSFDASSPATAVVTSGYFQELGRQLDIVQAILYNLYTSLTGVKFRPGITI